MDIRKRLKQFTQMFFQPTKGAWSFHHINNSNYKYTRTSLEDSNIIMSPVQWGMRQFLEAPLTVVKDGAMDGEHAAVELLRRPNDFYSWSHMAMAIVASLWIDGNAFLLIVRNGMLEPVELWFVPWWLIEPYSESENVFIEKYLYTVGGREFDLSPADVVHVRYGIDPHNLRSGLGPVKTAYREVYTDEEAANFTAAIMRNQGMPGAIITPDDTRAIPQHDVDDINDYFKRMTGGDFRGNPITLSRKVNVEQFGFAPDKMNMHGIRSIPEERVCTLLGIPAAVVGFGIGLEQTKVGATMVELRRMGYENAIIPTQRMVEEELNEKILREFDNDRSAHFAFDLSNVQVLQEDEGEKITRINRAVVGGWLPVNVAQQLAGFPVDESQNIYIRNMRSTTVPAQTAARGEIELKREPSNRAKEYFDYMERERIRLQGLFAAELNDRFIRWGNRIGDAIERRAQERGAAGHNGNGRKAGEDAFLEAIGDKVLIEIYEQYGGEVLRYDKQYMRTTESTLHGIENIYKRPANLTPELESEMITLAKDRERLLDLKQQTRGAITKAIRKGRMEGETLEQIAQRIRHNVGAGPWASSKTRSEVVARTETKLAQNLANVKAGKSTGAEYFEIIDGQLPTSDEFCIARNGKIVQASQTETLAFTEHPNGTLSFAPYYDSESGAELAEDVRPEPSGGWGATKPPEKNYAITDA